MRKNTLVSSVLIGSLALAPLAGCESLPGGSKEQGAVIGGVGGALAGAAVSKNERGLGALIGGVLGAGGGYLIGANKDKLDGKNREKAVEAHRNAERNPAKPEEVESARSADINDDGFVTLDEVVAMERANLSDREILQRLERTGQVFELTSEQEGFLQDRGVSREVVVGLRQMNQPESENARTASAREDAREGARDDRRSSPDAEGDRIEGDRIREGDRPRDFDRLRDSDQFGDRPQDRQRL